MLLALLVTASALAGWVTPATSSPSAELYVPEPLQVDLGGFPYAILGPDGNQVAWIDRAATDDIAQALDNPRKYAGLLYLGFDQRNVTEHGCTERSTLSVCHYTFTGRGDPRDLWVFSPAGEEFVTILGVLPDAGQSEAITTLIGSARPAGSTAVGPGTEAEATRVANRWDQDGDKVTDQADRCPQEPEDHDGVADDDGCPDAVNSEVFQPRCDAGDVAACTRYAESLREEGRSALADRVLRDRCDPSNPLDHPLCLMAVGEAADHGDLRGAMELAEALCDRDLEEGCRRAERLAADAVEQEYVLARSPAGLPLAALDRKVPGPCGARESWTGGSLDEDPFGRWTQTWSADGRTATRAREEDDGRVILRHDAAGREIEHREERGDYRRVTRTTYDAAGRPIERTIVGGDMAGTTRWTWDERGRLQRRVESRAQPDRSSETEVSWVDDQRGIEVTTYASGSRPERFEIVVDEQGRELRRGLLPESGAPTEWVETSWGPFGAVEERLIGGEVSRLSQRWTWDAHGNLLEHKRYPTWGPPSTAGEPRPDAWVRYDYGCW